MAQSQPQQIIQAPSSVSWDAVSAFFDAATSCLTLIIEPSSLNLDTRSVPSRATLAILPAAQEISVGASRCGRAAFLRASLMGFVGTRGRLRSTLARGKGRNFRDGAGAFVKNAVGDRAGAGGGAGFTTGVGAGFTTGAGANVGARFTTGGGFLTGGGTGSTAKGPSRGGCAWKEPPRRLAELVDLQLEGRRLRGSQHYSNRCLHMLMGETRCHPQ